MAATISTEPLMRLIQMVRPERRSQGTRRPAREAEVMIMLNSSSVMVAISWPTWGSKGRA